MPKFIINNPKDLLVVRVDSAIARVPVGKGDRKRSIVVDEETKVEKVVYRSDDPGLDLAYVSVEELAPANEAVLRDKLIKAFRTANPSDILADAVIDHFNQLAQIAINAAIIDKAIKNTPKDDTESQNILRDSIVPFIINGKILEPEILPPFVSDIVYKEAAHEMERLFPHAKELVDVIKRTEQYPCITIDKSKLEAYFKSHQPKYKDIETHVDQLIGHLRDQCESHQLSASSKELVAKVKKFPEQIKDARLRPLMELPFIDDSLTFHLSSSAFISDWAPRLTSSSTAGCYEPGSGTIILPTKPMGEREYLASEFLGQPLLECCKDFPGMVVSVANPLSLNKIYFEEMFHYDMHTIFKNGAVPYTGSDPAGKKAYIDAFMADVTTDGEHANPEAIDRLGLTDYMDDLISLRQHVEEGARAFSFKNLGVEIVAKVARLINEQGWDTTRKQFPHLCEDFEKRVLPQCYAFCKEHGIATPDTSPSMASGRGKTQRITLGRE